MIIIMTIIIYLIYDKYDYPMEELQNVIQIL